MDHKFTEEISQWLNTPEEERDYKAGALLLLKLSGNQIMYLNNLRNPESCREFIAYQIQKYYNFRVQQLTHEQVEEMAAQVEVIAEKHSLTETPSNNEDEDSGNPEAKNLGKREGHDLLPDEIKAKFVENLDLLCRMRELHLRLRTMSLDNASCPDSESYPFPKELIELDKKLHKNWEEYDRYVISSPQATPSNAAKKTTAKKSTKTTSKKK